MFGLLGGKRDRHRGWTPASGSDRRGKWVGLPAEVCHSRDNSEMGAEMPVISRARQAEPPVL
jgi:hypothetical protein